MTHTHYEVLGIARSAASVEIEAAFRERMAEFRERTYAGTHTLDDMREAYRVLSNAVSRAGYDETLPREPRPERRQGGAPGWIKWALPVVIVAAIAGFATMKLTRKNPDVVMNVGPITRVEAPAAEPEDPTRPAPVVIAPPAPLETGTVPTAAVALTPGGSAENVFASASPSIARIHAKDGSGRIVSQGSGVVIGPGIVITNCHVTKDSEDITVKVGRDEMRATLLASDEEHDLCRLAVGGLGAPPVTISSVSQLKTGQRVFAIGAPHGLELTISEGIVSSLRPVVDGTVIQTSAPISPGSSGGGLFDASGRLVGIVTFQHRFGQNLNFALPADWIISTER